MSGSKLSPVRALRNKYNLSVLQFAKAVDRSPGAIEAWEQGRRTPKEQRWIKDRLRKYRSSGLDVSLDNNLLFGTFEFGLARQLLQKDLIEIAREHGYRRSAWQSFEMNRRAVHAPLREKLEEQILRKLQRLAIV